MSELPHQFSKYMHPYFTHPYTAEERKQIIGERLLSLRKSYRITQKEVSEIIGVSPQTYSGYEKGKFEPSSEILIRIAFLYNTTLDYIAAKNYFHGQEDEEEEEMRTYNPENIKTVEERLGYMESEISEIRKLIKQNKE